MKTAFYIFIIAAAFGLSSCATHSGCPSAAITSPKSNLKDALKSPFSYSPANNYYTKPPEKGLFPKKMYNRN